MKRRIVVKRRPEGSRALAVPVTPPEPVPAVTPWLAVIQTARATYEPQRWRCACLHRLDSWQEFAVAWSTAGSMLVSAGMPHGCPPGMELEDALAWAWAVVDPYIHAAIQVIVQRSVLDSLSAEICLDIMAGSGIVYPDGTVAAPVLARVGLDVAFREAELALAVTEAQKRIEELSAPKKGTP